MKREDLDRIMERLENEILPNFKSLLSSRKEELRNHSLDDFWKFAKTLARDISLTFTEMLEITGLHTLEPIDQLVFWTYIASNLNSVLYPNYPFIFTIAYTEEDGEYHFVTTLRTLISSHHNYIPPASIPFLYAETRQDAAHGDLTRQRLIPTPKDLLDIID